MNTKTKLRIEGMHCVSCVSSVESALQKVSGVTNVAVNLDFKKAVVEGRVNSEALVSAVQKAGFSAEVNREEGKDDTLALVDLSAAKAKMILSWVFTLPVMILMFLVMMLDVIALPKVYSQTFILVLSSLTIFYPGGATMYRGFKNLFYFNPNMDTLITVGCLASWLTGVLCFFVKIEPFTGISGMIMAFHLTGKYIETKVRGRSHSAIRGLMNLQAKMATVVNNAGEETRVDIRNIKIGDVIVVKAGESIASDGVVVEGVADIDESIVSGESNLVTKKRNDKVVGGTICLESTIKVKIEKTGENTFISQVIRLIENAQNTKAPIQLISDKIVRVFVPAILLLSVLTFFLWFLIPGKMGWLSQGVLSYFPILPSLSDPLVQAFYSSIAVLVIACPCALGLATPTALLAGTGLAAKHGVLIRNAASIQKTNEADIVFLDKTGTLTKGRPRVSGIKCFGSTKEEDLIQLSASISAESSHPLARSLVRYANKTKIGLFDTKNIKVVPGSGIEGDVLNKKVKIGTHKFVGCNRIIKTPETAVFVSWDNKDRGCFLFLDQIREEAKDTVEKIKDLNIKPIIVTGDRKDISKHVSGKLEIEQVYWELAPDQKQSYVSRYQKTGKTVVMVGDGINDAPALSQADVGIVLGRGTDIALDSGDIILTGEGIKELPKVFALSEKVFKKIKSNIFWACFYNILAIPLAVIGLLHPVLAEIAMALSSISVLFNSGRLESVQIK